MKFLGFAAITGFLLAGCAPGWEDLLVTKLKGGETRIPQDPQKPGQAFEKDTGTVFLADFNGKAANAVTGDSGLVDRGSFPKSLFGQGLKLDPSAGKAVCVFPSTAPLSMLTGSMEVLVRNDSPSSGFNHILDKSWLYGLSNHDGNLAVHFGGGLHGWWYSSVALPRGSWSYVAVTYDGETLKLYLNGALSGSTPNQGGKGDPSYDLGIGNASDPGFDIPFTGIIDEARLSKVVRSPEEIAKAWRGIAKRIGGK